MKTLTLKSAQNIPAHYSYAVEVDGVKIGLLKAGETEYFDIEENATSILVRMQGAKSNSIDISENTHQCLIINSKKLLIYNYLFSGVFLIITFIILFSTNFSLEINAAINISIAIMLYLIFKKSKFSCLQISLIKNI